MAPPPPGRLASAVVGPIGCGPAGWSAALALGLSTQVARREAVAVVGSVPRNPGLIHYVSRSASTKRRDEQLRPVEVALLEVLRDWDGLVESSTTEAVARIKRLVDSGAVRLERVAVASTTEPPRVRERLRHLLIALSQPDLIDLVHRASRQSVRRDLALVD